MIKLQKGHKKHSFFFFFFFYFYSGITAPHSRFGRGKNNGWLAGGVVTDLWPVNFGFMEEIATYLRANN